MKHRYFKTIWISDLHLGTKGCRANDLIEFLTYNHCETLYLIGDIIDGWRLKKKRYWPQSHSDIVEIILEKAKNESKIIYCPGNHDDFLRNFLDEEINLGNITITERASHKTLDGRRFLIIHGDQFDIVTRYHKWISHLGDMSYVLLLKINRLFNYFRAKFGMGYWSLSSYVKLKFKKAVNFISAFEDSLSYECDKLGYDGVICGHIHKPEIKSINRVLYCNSGDWVESCSFLTEDYKGNIEIHHHK